MTKIVLDESLRSKLNGCNEEVEVYDQAGQAVGHFVPIDLYRKLLHAYAESQCPYTAEELARFQQETGGSTLAEIWKQLGQA